MARGGWLPFQAMHLPVHVTVSKNRGIPKWMVKIMEKPIKIHDLGGTLFFGNTYME